MRATSPAWGQADGRGQRRGIGRRWLGAVMLGLATWACVGPAGAQTAPTTGPAATSPAAAGAPIRIALIEGLSGSFANAGEAVYRNLLMAVERVNARGGVRIAGVARPLELLRFDGKGTTEDTLAMFRSAVDRGVTVVMQGNSSSAASALIDAINKHNEREPQRQAVFLNYSAVDPALTNEKCSFWHFRFDAHADMRLAALTEVLRGDRSVRRIYLIGQDYSFGQYVLKRGREMLREKRPDIEVVGDELHPLGRVKDFAPYAAKIKASGAEAVLTGNWGNDLTLLVKAAREAGVDARFYTFYGNGLGAPAAIGEAGVGRVLAVAEWHPNVGTPASDAFYAAFQQRFPKPQDDYVHARMHAMIELLAAAIERAGGTEAAAIARAMEGLSLGGPFAAVHQGTMRAADHQFIQPLVVSEMQRVGTPGTRFDNEGSGYGFRSVLSLPPARTELPTSCRMQRPSQERM